MKIQVISGIIEAFNTPSIPVLNETRESEYLTMKENITYDLSPSTFHLLPSTS